MESTGGRNWGPFVAGLLIVGGLGLCLSTLALAWWWTHPDVGAFALPTLAVSPPSAAPGTGAQPSTPQGMTWRTPTVGPRTPEAPAPVGPPPTRAANPPAPTPVPTVAPQPPAGAQVPLLVEDFSIFGASGVLDGIMASPAGRQVRVIVREETLNRDLAYLAEIAKAEKEVHMDPVTVELWPEGIYVSGEAKVGLLRGRYQVLAQITVHGCRPKVRIQKLHIGGLPAPGFVRQQLEDEVARSVDLWLAGLPLCIDQVLLERGRGTVVGHR